MGSQFSPVLFSQIVSYEALRVTYIVSVWSSACIALSQLSCATMWRWLSHILLLSIALTPWSGLAGPSPSTSLMSIDLGSDFLKVGLVKADRIPISVAVNEMSKRKTPALVGIPGDDRILGEEAATMSVRYPDEVV